MEITRVGFIRFLLAIVAVVIIAILAQETTISTSDTLSNEYRLYETYNKYRELPVRASDTQKYSQWSNFQCEHSRCYVYYYTLAVANSPYDTLTGKVAPDFSIYSETYVEHYKLVAKCIKIHDKVVYSFYYKYLYLSFFIK